MENTIGRSEKIGHGLVWHNSKPESELSNEAFQREVNIARDGLDYGYKIGLRDGNRIAICLACFIGIAAGSIAMKIVLNKLKNSSK